jgi:hypothetical protein
MPLGDFVIYSPETSAIRTFEREGQIPPLGIRGEGLLKLLRVLASEDQDSWHALQYNLKLLDWLVGIDIDHDSALPEQSIRIRDRFMAATYPAFDQRSANEGFLYLLFFFALILSKATPSVLCDRERGHIAESEGVQRVLAYYHDRDSEPLVVFEQPTLDATGRAGRAGLPHSATGAAR